MKQTELTGVERDVLAGAAAGESIKETALRIGCKPATVSAHRRHILGKLDAKNITQAAAIAAQRAAAKAAAGEPISDRQRSAFYAKLNRLVERRGVERDRTKREILTETARHFGIEVESVNDLTYAQASHALDLLEARLDQAPILDTALHLAGTGA